MLPSLNIGGLVANLPFVQGGMGVGISLSGLASAVANEGGIGVISAAIIGFSESDLLTNYRKANIRALRREIRKARELTKGVLGVNIMVALTNFADMVKTAVEEEIDVIFCGAGLPLELPALVSENAKSKLVPIVSSARAARVICKRWLSRFQPPAGRIRAGRPPGGGASGLSPEISLTNRNFPCPSF